MAGVSAVTNKAAILSVVALMLQVVKKAILRFPESRLFRKGGERLGNHTICKPAFDTMTTQVYIRSTDVDRTLMSAAANLQGLFPPEG